METWQTAAQELSSAASDAEIKQTINRIGRELRTREKPQRHAPLVLENVEGDSTILMSDLLEIGSDLRGTTGKFGNGKDRQLIGNEVTDEIDADRMRAWVYPEWITKYRPTEAELWFLVVYFQWSDLATTPAPKHATPKERMRYVRLRRQFQNLRPRYEQIRVKFGVYMCAKAMFDLKRERQVKEHARKQRMLQK